ncbi:HAD family hydrolase [Streptomyces echinoruber]|uniref:HAD family hydrolase n=1 Tax=Streptomyces echinoruber TaxID=68898 RepID=UPI00167E2AA3|nr:HAD family phosphatase [Streptomyces echinoruber]
MAVTTLVCDYGGVLTNPLAETYLAFSDHTGIPLDELQAAFGRAAHRYGVSPMAELETGAIEEEELVRRVVAELPEELRGRDLLGGRPFGEVWFRGRRANRELLAFLRLVRAEGHRVALLTNNVRAWRPRWRATLSPDGSGDLGGLFDLVVDSSEEGVRKPDPEIYRRLLSRLGAAPETVLFLDDLEENCAAARALGMRAVRFETTAQAVADVAAAMGVPVGAPHHDLALGVLCRGGRR